MIRAGFSDELKKAGMDSDARLPPSLDRATRRPCASNVHLVTTFCWDRLACSHLSGARRAWSEDAGMARAHQAHPQAERFSSAHWATLPFRRIASFTRRPGGAALTQRHGRDFKPNCLSPSLNSRATVDEDEMCTNAFSADSQDDLWSPVHHIVFTQVLRDVPGGGDFLSPGTERPATAVAVRRGQKNETSRDSKKKDVNIQS